MDKIFFGQVVPQMDWSVLPIEFLKDRAELRGGSREDEPAPLDPKIMMAAAKNQQQQLHHFLTLIEHQLKTSPTGWFLGTATPHYADFQLYAPIQFIAGLQQLPGSGVAKGFEATVFPTIWKWHAALQETAATAMHPQGNVPISPEDALKEAEKASKAGIFAKQTIQEKAGVVGVSGDDLGINSEVC
jgi:hypothetical protein